MKTTSMGAKLSAQVGRAKQAGTDRTAHMSALVMVMLFCGILSPAIYVATDVLAGNLDAGYSYTDQAVSELFAIGAPTSQPVVSLFTLSSALLVPFAAAVWLSADNRRTRRILAIVFLCSAVDSLLLWNFFPMHMRGAERSLTDTMHLVFAANPFVLASLVLGAMAGNRAFRAYSIVTTAVLLALASYGFSYAPAVASNAPTPWMGLTERIAQYAYGLWQAVLTVTLMRESRR